MQNTETPTQYTPEPWIAVPPDADCKSWSILREPGQEEYKPGDTYVIAFMALRSESPRGDAASDAKHIVACVNACTGMADPGAEIKRLKRYDEIPKCHHGYVSLSLHLWDCPICTENLRQENADLLKALQKIANGDFPTPSYSGGEISSEEERAYHYQGVANAAIAKANNNLEGES